MTRDPLVSLLFVLMRDYMHVGGVEQVVDDASAIVNPTGPLADLAAYFAGPLRLGRGYEGSCRACNVEAELGTEEVPHPVDPRVHSCREPARAPLPHPISPPAVVAARRCVGCVTVLPGGPRLCDYCQDAGRRYELDPPIACPGCAEPIYTTAINGEIVGHCIRGHDFDRAMIEELQRQVTRKRDIMTELRTGGIPSGGAGDPADTFGGSDFPDFEPTP